MTQFAPTPHPLMPLPTVAEMEDILKLPNGDEELAEFYRLREEKIALASDPPQGEPFYHGFELDHWADADRLLGEDIILLMVFGGNRSSKSEYAAKRIVQAAMAHENMVQFCLHESMESSIGTQQKYIWRYLPTSIRRLNDRRNPIYKIKYTQAGGFTEGKVVFPNRSELYFLSYKQDPGAFEGWELGAVDAPAVGVWADENMPLPWLNMLKLRLASRRGKCIWTFTPVRGMTPTIKELVGAAPQTLQSRFAELLPDRVNVTGLPVGHMPYIQQPHFRPGRLIYFHSDLNPFGHHYEQIKKLCEGMPSEYIERRAYGFARDTGARAFPLFGEQNIVKQAQLPDVGSNYMITDPAGSRNWAVLWVRVTPGNPPEYYIYREWPDAQRYGEWAITAANPNKYDGEKGPAQNPLGYGIVQYKNLFLNEEKVWKDQPQVDPYRKALAGKLKTESSTQEKIDDRLIDPRAGRNQHAAEKGGTCLIDELAKEHRHEKTGELLAPRLFFAPASGVDIQEGITAINTLLWWEKEKTLMPVVNAPRLYVADNCLQLIWAMSNWTGLDGEHGACKDMIDCLRYMALGELQYRGEGTLRTKGGGSY